MRVLVVEDEQLLADAVATGLRREAMAVDVVYDGAAALERIGVHDYEGLALDSDEKVRLVADLGTHKVLLLRNHGFLTCGASVARRD